MAGTIGIKQANGNFYSILEENSAVKKRLVLTTVHDDQKSVQIDLYKSTTKTMADSMYIGSIVVENIEQKPKGEPSIEMTLGSTSDGSISASAIDLANPENEHHLSISLKSLEEDKNEYPDFDLDSGTKQKNKFEAINPSRKFPWLVIIIIGLVLALICLGLWFFLFRNKGNQAQQTDARQAPAAIAVQQEPREQPAPVTQQEAAPPAAQPVTEAQATEKQPVVIEKPPAPQPQARPRTRSTAPVYSFNVPQTIPPEGIAYTIRWGDTLWDISEAFYRNPRHYPYIVRSNGIRNQNLIVAGTEITILPRDQ